MAATNNPQVSKIAEKDGILGFTISGLNVSFVNALRRAIMSNIPVIVFKTTPYEENKCTIIENTISGINNEFIKHRLSGIPIHITDIKQTPLQNYIMELDVENKTDTIVYVTSGDFKVKNVVTDKYLSDVDLRNIFPPNDLTGDHILFLKLKPQLSDAIPGEAIRLKCEFSQATSGQDGMYIQACTCSYGNSPDGAAMDAQLAKEIQNWRNEDGSTKEQIDLKIANWKLLDGMRYYIKNSFDFIVESIGVYTNRELILLASNYLIDKLGEVRSLIESGDFRIEASQTTIPNSFDIFLEHDEDYTVGTILEHLMYATYCEPGLMASNKQQQIANFVGLKKFHPHDKFLVLRVGYVQPQEPGTVLNHLSSCALQGMEVIKNIKNPFMANRVKNVIYDEAAPDDDVATDNNEGPIKVRRAPRSAK